MALLAAIVMKKGHLVQAFDMNAWRPANGDEVLKEIMRADQWDIVAVGGLSTTYKSVRTIVRCAKDEAPQALIVAGGGILTSMPRDIMTLLPEITVGIVGEAYETLPEVLERWGTREDPHWGTVKGIIWRDARNEIYLNEPRPLMQNIDSLPFPAYELFPLEEVYFKNSMLILSEESMAARRRLDINASYGCSLICRFCFHLGIAGDMVQVDTPNGKDTMFTYERNLRWHSPRYVVDLVKYIHERFGVDFVSFFDENLMTMNASSGGTWLPEICRLWIAEGLQPSCIRDGVPHNPDTCKGVHFGGTSHATLVKEDVLHQMRKAGCSYLDYGLESFSDRILKNIGKGSTCKFNERAIKITMNAGIRPIPNQIIGFPDEFFDSILADMDAWDRLGVVVYPFFATPYPGSEWFYTYKNKILEQYDGKIEGYLEDLGDATKITAVISENFTAVELLGLRELMVKHDRKRILAYEKVWRKLHGEPKLPRFTSDNFWERVNDQGRVTKVKMSTV